MISHETAAELERLVKRVTHKTGYSNLEEQYMEQLNRQLDQKFEQINFAEEIRTYLKDGISDLRDEGYSEKEALQMTLKKFDEADIQEDFSDFMRSFNDFGMAQWELNVNGNNGVAAVEDGFELIG